MIDSDLIASFNDKSKKWCEDACNEQSTCRTYLYQDDRNNQHQNLDTCNLFTGTPTKADRNRGWSCYAGDCYDESNKTCSFKTMYYEGKCNMDPAEPIKTWKNMDKEKCEQQCTLEPYCTYIQYKKGQPYTES